MTIIKVHQLGSKAEVIEVQNLSSWRQLIPVREDGSDNDNDNNEQRRDNKSFRNKWLEKHRRKQSS